MRKKLYSLVILFLILPVRTFAQDDKLTADVFGKTHSIFTTQNFSGAGSNVSNLANTYDMSIFEFNLGGKQSTFNGSGITTNSNFPLTDGDAFSNNTEIGILSTLSKDLKAGISAQFYTLVGDRTVGRTFGEELPWDNFPRDDSGAVKPHRASLDIYNAFVEGKYEDFKYKITGGTLTPRDLPEFTRKEMNQVKLGSFVYRTPITNASFFEKEDRKIEEGRHPLRGLDFIGDYLYLDDKSIHVEIFGGETKPTPLSDIDRDVWGTRTAIDILKGNIGAAYVFNRGVRDNTSVDENQGVWSIDSSYNVQDWLVPYFTFAQTRYERENTGEKHKDNAYVAGTLIKLPHKYEVKTQYQHVEENYDLMAIHKSEHYPTNSHGANVQVTVPATDNLKFKGTFYALQQLDITNPAGDTLFGDSFFPALANSEKGRIQVQRLSGDWKLNPKLSFNGYVEHARFKKKAATSPTSIDKDVYNFYTNLVYALMDKLNLELGFRHFQSLGEWQAMSFDSYQDIPEIAVTYKFNKESSAHLIYHYYNFEDENTVAQGRNDYYGNQLMLDVKIYF